jgi:hypothetical protein
MLKTEILSNGRSIDILLTSEIRSSKNNLTRHIKLPECVERQEWLDL